MALMVFPTQDRSGRKTACRNRQGNRKTWAIEAIWAGGEGGRGYGWRPRSVAGDGLQI